jgi:predicted amidohydrolase
MRAAVIQLRAGDSKERNISKALSLVKCAVARKAKFILLPEAFHFRGKINPRRGYADIAEEIPGPSLKPFMQFAKDSKVNILAGSVCERIPGSQKVYNTSVLVNERGRIVAKYRKSHLFDATIGKVRVRESQHVTAGKNPVMATIGAWKMGLSICYDLRFADFYGSYRNKKADILCVPSAFTRMTGRAHWEVLLRARAIEGVCYVLAPNQIGKDAKGVVSYGNSMIVDPWGMVLARASGDREEIIFADLDKRVLRDKRKIIGI